MRCLALAAGLAQRGFGCRFAVRPDTLGTVPALAHSPYEIIELVADDGHDPSVLGAALKDPCNVLVVDHYALSIQHERHWRSVAQRIVVIDDLANRGHDADLLVDQNLGRKAEEYRPLVPPHCRILVGPAYALVRPEFSAARDSALAKRAASTELRRILVSFGLTDSRGATLLALQAIAASKLPVVVDVMIGSASPHLQAIRRAVQSMPIPTDLHVDVADVLPLLLAADLCIGASGSSSWERCCVGLPMLLITTADNQRLSAESLAVAGAALHLGRLEGVNSFAIAAALRSLSEGAVLAAMAKRAAEACDGLGVERVVAAVQDLLDA